MSSSLLKEKHNFQCVSEASVILIKLPLKDILLSQIRPEDLFLEIHRSSLLHGKNKLRSDQLKLCYFPPPVLPDYNKFDATLLYTLIRNLCSGLEPTRGWGNEPGPKDTKIGDDVERLRFFRNNNFAHLNSATIPDDTFENVWKTLKSVLIRLKSHSGCSVDYVKKFGEIEYSQFRYELWEQYKDIWSAYLEIKKQTDERAIRIKGNEEVICGNSAIFDAEVEQAENFCLPIIWQRRRGKLVEIIDPTLEKYSGSTNTRLVMSSVCKTDAMEYQAFLPDGYNQMLYSNTINLHVLGEKPFLNDLEVTTEDEEIKIHYSFGVSENSPHVQDITWSKNGNPMYIGYDKFFRGSLHDSCLIIKSPSEDDKGKYSCTVTNAVGSKEKDIVLDVPCIAISTKPKVHFASDTTITSIVTSKPQPEKAQWQNSKNGNDFYEMDVTKSKYFGSNVSPECPRLVIPKTTFHDMLYYRLQISNKLGVNVSNIVYLKVTGSLPNITVGHETDINNRSIKLRGVVFLSKNSPDIQNVFWSKNGEKIDIQGSGGRLSGVTIDDPSLTIRDVSQEDAGNYQLTAINAVGPNDSDVISIDVPYLYIRSEKILTGEIECICYTVEITSNPGPCHAQWNLKSKGEETFSPLDVNAEKYQGSTNSLPHPKLVIKEKDQLKKNIYQIKVTNFVGSTVKEISDDEIRPLQKQEEHKLFRTADVDGNIAFARLNNYLAMNFPHEKLPNLKCLLLDTKQIENAKCLKEANNARECFSILHDENLFTRNDVILMQFLCKETRCDDLYEKCIKFAKKYKALCFIENPPDNGYKKVAIHIQKDFKSFGGSQIQEIVKIVAAMLDCEHEEILVVDARPSGSVILILSVKEKYAWKFTALNEEDCQKLRKLKIDYLIMDGKSILLDTSTEISERKPVYIMDETCTKSALPQIHPTLHTSQLSMTESLNKEDVMKSLSAIQITERENRRVGNQCLLKLTSGAKFHQSLTLTGVDRCYHISCVTSDRVWVNDGYNLMLTDTTGVPLHRVKDSCGGDRGFHTVNSESELIYIDRNYNINKLSKDMKKTTTFIERTDFTWEPRCVYWSPSTGDLLVGMYRKEPRTGKVIRYIQSGQLTQTIQHDNTGWRLYREPIYITENNNGDVVVSDLSGAVVVTERGGRYRFSYIGPPSGSVLEPCGICTDALSHILVCDDTTKTVQMLDRDGQFLSHLLTESQEMDVPRSLSYDVNTHCLWVGSGYNNTVVIYRYITRQNALTDEHTPRPDGDALFNLTPAEIAGILTDGPILPDHEGIKQNLP